MKKNFRFIISVMLISSMITGCGAVAETKEENLPSKGGYTEMQIYSSESKDKISSLFSKENKEYLAYNYDSGNVICITEDGSVNASKYTSYFDKVCPKEDVFTVAFDHFGNSVIEYTKPGAEKESEETQELSTVYAYHDKDGFKTDIILDIEGDFITKFEFSDENQLYGMDNKGIVYKIDPISGQSKKLFVTNGSSIGFNCVGNYVIVADTKDVFIYQIDSEKLIEDTGVINDFIDGENIRTDDYAVFQDRIVFCKGDEPDSFYMITSSGLYHFVLGGTSIERLIDGNHSKIGDPSIVLKSLCQMQNGDFLIAMQEGEILSCHYNKDLVREEQTQLKIYSLRENDTVRKMISIFEEEHPEVYVNYEYGITDNDSVTYEDALKNLNVEIAAGQSPDIILLDDLPIDTYVEKGILLNLKNDKNSIYQPEEVMTAITESLADKKGNLYAMPAGYQLPLLIGKKEQLKTVKDLSSLADLYESHLGTKRSATVSSLCTPGEVLESLLFYCGNDLKKDNQINKKKMTEYLTDAKRIYEVEKSFCSDKVMEIHDKKQAEESSKEAYQSFMASEVCGKSKGILDGVNNLGTGICKDISYGYALICSCQDMDSDIVYQNGLEQESGCFIPTLIFGVSALTENKELALKFMHTVFEKSAQTEDDNLEAYGITVNNSAMNALYEKGTDEPEQFGALSGQSELTGESYMIKWCYPTKVQYQSLKDIISNLHTPCLTDQTIKAAVLSIGPDALTGRLSIEEAVDEIDKKVKLKLAE